VSDICEILTPARGPFAVVANLGVQLRGGGTGRANTARGTAAFDDAICQDFEYVEVLAGTMLHEAVHHSGGFSWLNRVLIIDDPAPCSVESIEDVCSGMN